jgi:hypothetical protein
LIKHPWEIGQWLGMLALVAGVVLMLVRHEPAGSCIVTVSSLLFATATKLRYYSGRRRRRPRIEIASLVGRSILTGRALPAPARRL